MLKISVETVLAQQGFEETEVNNDSEQIDLGRKKKKCVSPCCDQTLSLHMFKIILNLIIIICNLAKLL